MTGKKSYLIPPKVMDMVDFIDNSSVDLPSDQALFIGDMVDRIARYRERCCITKRQEKCVRDIYERITS